MGGRHPRAAKLFLEDLSGRWSRIRACIDLADATGWKAQAHALKGSAVSIGALRLSKAMADLEPMLAVDAKAALPRLEAEVDAVRGALTKELALSDATSGAEVRE